MTDTCDPYAPLFDNPPPPAAMSNLLKLLWDAYRTEGWLLQRNSVKIGSLPRAPPRPCRHPSPRRAALFMPTRVRLRRVENYRETQ